MERRNSLRKKPVGNAIAVLRPSYSKVGRIADVSFSGLCLEYHAARPVTSSPVTVDILVREGMIFITDLNCDLVWHRCTTAGIKEESFANQHSCGLSFNSLDPEQKAGLSQLMHYCQA